eukprot:7957744-Pyramimonas_sp.AAC.1
MNGYADNSSDAPARNAPPDFHAFSRDSLNSSATSLLVNPPALQRQSASANVLSTRKENPGVHS